MKPRMGLPAPLMHHGGGNNQEAQFLCNLTAQESARWADYLMSWPKRSTREKLEAWRHTRAQIRQLRRRMAACQ